MDLSTVTNALMNALVATWLMLAGPAGTQAYRLADDAPTIEQPRSGRFRLEASFTAGPEQASLAGQGAFVQPDRAQFSLDANASGRDEHYEAVVIGRTVYTRQGADGRWDSRDAADNPAFPFPTGSGGAPSRDPRLDEWLRGLQAVGVESVEGQPTDRYRGELDFLALARGITTADPSIWNAFTSFTLSVDLWIGQEDHYPHQLKIGLDARLREARPGQPDSVRGEIGATLSSFDQPITIAAPTGQAPLAPAPVAPAPVQAPAQLPARGGR